MIAKLFLACLIVFLPSLGIAQDEIRIGAVLPMSGSAQSFGLEARLALEHALALTK